MSRRTVLSAAAIMALLPHAAAQAPPGDDAGRALPGARSSDGRWRLVPHTPTQPQPRTLQLFDGAGRFVKAWADAARADGPPLHVAAIVDARTRRSFIVALHDVAEVWEISYDPRAEDIHTGLVHDYRMGESLPVRGFLNIRRTLLEAPARAPHFDADFTHFAADLPGEPRMAQIVNLDARRRIARVALDGALGPGRVEPGAGGRGWVWVSSP